MKIIPVSIVMFVKDITDEGLSVWAQERQGEGPYKGLLEFPGGKVEMDERPIDAAVREVMEEVGYIIEDPSKLNLFKLFSYTRENKTIVLNVFFMKTPDDFDDANGKWIHITKGQLSTHLKGKIPDVNHGFLDEFTLYIMLQKEKKLLDTIWKLSHSWPTFF